MTGGFGGEDRLEVAGVHDGRLDELGLTDGCGDLQERLIREDDGPLGDRPHVAREPQVGKKAEEPIVEPARGRQVRERILREAEALEVAEDVLKPRGDEERPVLRELSHEEAERGGLVHALPEVRGAHGELVEIGEEGGVSRDDRSRDEGPQRRWDS